MSTSSSIESQFEVQNVLHEADDHGLENEESRAHLLSIPSDVGRKRSGAKISIEGLDRFSDDGTRILSNCSLQVKTGEVMAIIGPSGSGKSTMLRAINRLWEPPTGTIFVDGEDITLQDVMTVRRRCGMLFQTPMLFDGTVADNVGYGPKLMGKKLTMGEVEHLLQLADLDPSFASKSIIGLSVGQAQRVALARTLANKPEILLLDEPTSALDPISTRHVEETVLKLARKRGLTTVIVSHSLDQVHRIADTVCLVAGGEILEILRPDELDQAQHPVVQEFIAVASQH